MLESIRIHSWDHADYLYLYGILICFVLSIFFAAVETALTSLSRIQIERMIQSGGFFSSSLKAWKDHPNRILATILIADTLTDTATATLTASFMINNFPEVNIITVTGFLTVIVLIFGEILPKTVARSFPEQLAPLLCRVLSLFDYLLLPLTLVVSTCLSWFLRLFGIRLSSSQKIRSGDIESMVLLATREGSMEREKTEILSSVFQFSKRRVRDIMIPRDQISALPISATLEEVLDVVRHENHSRYPVYNGSLDRIVGFLHARDLFAAIRHASSNPSDPSTQNFSLRTCLRRAFFVADSMMISRVLHDMKSSRIHLAIIKDEWGNVVGLITLEDILEEVFGEIEDEHDEQRPRPVIDMYSSGIEVDGGESLLDLKSKYGIEIETTESYSTLNGFLQHYASFQQISPKMIIIWNRYVFSIVSVKDGEIERVRITETPGDEESR